MSSTIRPPTSSSSTTTQPQPHPHPTEKSFFEQQREVLLKEIGVSFEHVLANINKLNRSLEAAITVGNEFSAVEALWSQFENVMAKDPDAEAAAAADGGEEEHGEEGGHGVEHGEDDTTQLQDEGSGNGRRR